jgi:mRNA interferase RelE/StbE
MYRIEIKNKARKEIISLPRREQERVMAAINILRENPFVGKKLAGEHEGARSLRVWPYRIIYVIYEETVTVKILRVGHRQGVYK